MRELYQEIFSEQNDLCGIFFHKTGIRTSAFVEIFAGIEFGFLSVIKLAYWAVIAHNSSIDFTLGSNEFAALCIEESFVHRDGGLDVFRWEIIEF